MLAIILYHIMLAIILYASYATIISLRFISTSNRKEASTCKKNIYIWTNSEIEIGPF